MESNILNPYYDTLLNIQITLIPAKINNDIRKNIVFELRKNILHKCVSIGFVYSIDDKNITYDNGEVDDIHFTSDTTFNVSCNATICNPIIDKLIIAKISKIDIGAELTTAENGPIICVLISNLIDHKIFNVVDYNITHKESKKKLEIGDFVFVRVKQTKFYKDASRITVIGALENIILNIDKIDSQYHPKTVEQIKIIKPQNKFGKNAVIYNEDLN